MDEFTKRLANYHKKSIAIEIQGWASDSCEKKYSRCDRFDRKNFDPK
jgi:hypothetical protein